MEIVIGITCKHMMLQEGLGFRVKETFALSSRGCGFHLFALAARQFKPFSLETAIVPGKTLFNATQRMECNRHTDGLVRGHSWPSPAFSAVAEGEREGEVGRRCQCQTAVRSRERSSNWPMEERRLQSSLKVRIAVLSLRRSRSCFDPSKRTGNNTSPVRPRCQSCSGPGQGRQVADSHWNVGGH